MEAISQIFRSFQGSFQNISGVSVKGRTVRIVDITNQAGYLTVLRSPGQDGERVKLRVQILIRLLYPSRILDGAAVQHDLPIQRSPNLGGCDCHIFQLSKNVGELHPNKLDVLVLHQPEDVRSVVGSHRYLLLA